MATKRHLPPETDGFVNAFVDDIADGTAAIFAGAGLSVASGHVNWSELLREIAAELGLDVDRESNLVAVAQYHLNARGTRSRINQKLIDEFSVGHTVNHNHEILARLPIATYWTTNYDRLIETALDAAGKIVDVKFAVDQLKTNVRGRSATLFKMHGDVSDPEHAVLTKDDYEGYFRDREPFVTALAGDLTTKTFLFLGFSFTDPNIDYVMSRVRVVLHRKTKQHYCILKRESRRAREKLAGFQYRKLQQDYFIRDLSRIGIQAILIDDYSDLTRILRLIETRYRQRRVFIAGSAHDFDPFQPDEAGMLIEAISGGLVKGSLGIVTGFGLGVGPSVISGAMQVILGNPKRYRDTQLEAMPFPIGDGGKTLYRAHREAMIAKCGIAIFLFGNKRDTNGNVVLADGVDEEYEIARSLNLKIIAVGCTGWAAQHIWEAERPAFAHLPSSAKKSYELLGRLDLRRQRIVSALLAVVGALRSSASAALDSSESPRM